MCHRMINCQASDQVIRPPKKVLYPLVFPSLLICTTTSDTSTTLGNANQNKTPAHRPILFNFQKLSSKQPQALYVPNHKPECFPHQTLTSCDLPHYGWGGSDAPPRIQKPNRYPKPNRHAKTPLPGFPRKRRLRDFDYNNTPKHNVPGVR